MGNSRQSFHFMGCWTLREMLGRRAFDLHLEPFVGIERRQIVEMALVSDLLRILEIDRVDLKKGEIALAFLRTADRTLHCVAGLQRETADLRRRDLDVVRAGKVVGVCPTHEAEAVLQEFHDVVADDLDIILPIEQGPKALSHHRMVIDEQNTNLRST